MAKDTLTRMEEMTNILGDVVTKDELADFLEKVLAAIQKHDERIEKAIAGMEFTAKNMNYDTVRTSLSGEMDMLHKKSGDSLKKLFQSFESKHEMGSAMMRTKLEEGSMASMKHGEMMMEHMGKLHKLEDKITNLPISEIRGTLDEILTSLKNHEKRIKDLEDRPVRVGGGVTNMRIAQAFKYILRTEEPVGSIDGVVVTYSLSQPIAAIVSMSINGETIAQLPNYTISGRTFTFSTALPSAYSGKDFEVKYIAL